MMRPLIAVLLMMATISTLVTSVPAQAQQNAPVDVFVVYENSSVDLFFASTLTGLSATARVDGYNTPSALLDDFKMAVNGVVFTDPASEYPRLVTPGGIIFDFDFIPQSVVPPLNVNWVISDDGTRLAWAESTFENNRWQASIFTARLDGSELVQYPAPPAASQPTLRVKLIGVSNDGSRLLLDIDHPIAGRSEGADFDTYTGLRLYIAENRVYLPIAEDADCPCPVTVSNNLQTMLQLERPIIGNGFGIRIWNLSTLTFRAIPAVDTIYRQAGRPVMAEDGDPILFSFTQLEGTASTTASGIAIATLLDSSQRIISSPGGSDMRVVDIINRDRVAIVVDISRNTTFKLDLETGVFDQIADKMLLGTLTR